MSNTNKSVHESWPFDDLAIEGMWQREVRRVRIIWIGGDIVGNFIRHLKSWFYFTPSFVGIGGMGAKARERLFLTVAFAKECRG